MASIIVILGPNEGDYFPLGQRTSVVGRAEGGLIQILDEKVSRKHLQIHFDKGKQQYRAIDMRSRSGVFVNGRKISAETALVDSDIIRIGGTTLLFTVKDFENRESAISHSKKVGERGRETLVD